jgi:RND family efflux transporter MFP subunit
MATQSPSPSSGVPDLSIELLRSLELGPRARVIAAEVTRYFPGSAVVVYALKPGPPERWVSTALSGPVRIRATQHGVESHRPFALTAVAHQDWVAADSGTLGMLHKNKLTFTVSGAQLSREQYAHLDLSHSIASLSYIPLTAGGKLVGGIEIVSFQKPLDRQALTPVDDLAELAGAAIQSAIDYEEERNGQMESISRLTQMYDLERVFNSQIHMARLLPLVASKLKEIMEVQACNVWMVQGDDMILMARHGDDPTVAVGTVYKSGDGVAAEVSDSGKAILITKPEDARLVKRNGTATNGAINSVLACPIISQGYQVGALEVINKDNGQPLNDEDYFMLATVMPTVANALHNASLIEAERKLETLDTLVEVSREITSTLNLERILQVVVNGPQKIMTYDRAAIALEQRGKQHLKAISGKSEINSAEPGVKLLRETLEWVASQQGEVYVVQRGKEVDADREEVRLKFQNYFAQSGMRAFYAVPLIDEQGELGVLSFESRNPDFLSDMHFDIVKVLASQTTVALRNASLYTEVPFIGILEPLMQKKAAFLKMEKQRRIAVMAAVVGVIAALIIIPLPMRVVGDATVGAASTSNVQAPIEAVVSKVNVKEGDAVKAGAVLAELEDWDFRSGLAAAQAKYGTALAAMNHALAVNDGAEAGIQKNQVEYWGSEVQRAKERLDRTRVRAPIDGFVATPHTEQLAGRKLAVGDPVMQIVNTAKAQVDVAIEEDDVALLMAGEHAAVKLESFPTKRFTGEVKIVSPTGTALTDRRVFFARVDVPNEQGLLRPGMQGRGKVSTGWRPSGYVLLRPFGMWAWGKMWSWFGW